MTTEAPDVRRLLSAQELAEAGPPEAVLIPVDLVDPSSANPRERLPEVDALAASIADPKVGLLQPIIVRRAGERFEVVGGHRRLAAYKLLADRHPLEPRWKAIPAVIRTMEDDQAYVALVSAQVHSINWRPREQAAALERLAVTGMTLREIGERLSRTESWASKRLRIYSDVAVSALVQTGRLSSGVAEELLVIKDFETRKQYAQRAADEQWSQDRARGEVRALRLDKQLADLDRRTLELVNLLSAVSGPRISIATFRNLQVLAGRIEVLAAEARGETPRMPSIAEAERIAGVTEAAKARADAARQSARRAARRKR